jgi:hypothetical protein
LQKIMHKALTAFGISLASVALAHAMPPQMSPKAKVAGTVVE